MRAAMSALSSFHCEVVAIIVLAVVPSRDAPLGNPGYFS
jgi:hypothetical protein